VKELFVDRRDNLSELLANLEKRRKRRAAND